jgi:hypothetical protein
MSDKKKIVLLSIIGIIGILTLEFGLVWFHEYNLKDTIIGMLWFNLWIGMMGLVIGSVAGIVNILEKKDKEDD